MKKVFVLLSMFLSVSDVHSQTEKHTGVIERVTGSEIMVKYDRVNSPYSIGEKLHINTDTGSFTLEVTFPMQTSAKCRLASGDAGKIRFIKKGMAVFEGKALPVNTAVVQSGQPFKDNGDGTITDIRSGLVWLKNANITDKKKYRQDAVDFCKTLDSCGHKDWRLPSKSEVESFVAGYSDGRDVKQYFSSQGFFDIQEWYWTSTAIEKDPNFVWLVSMKSGAVYYGNPDYAWVWPVRGQMRKK